MGMEGAALFVYCFYSSCVITGQYLEYILWPELSMIPGRGCFDTRTTKHMATLRLNRPWWPIQWKYPYFCLNVKLNKRNTDRVIAPTCYLPSIDIYYTPWLKYVLFSQTLRGDQEEDRNTSRSLWTVASGALHQVHLADCKAGRFHGKGVRKKVNVKNWI